MENYLVHIHVKPTMIDEFILATEENAQNSIRETGVLRFDFLQQADDPTRFILVEVYQKPGDRTKHRETSHYQAWRLLVEEMMAEPRVGVQYMNLFPTDLDWK